MNGIGSVPTLTRYEIHRSAVYTDVFLYRRLPALESYINPEQSTFVMDRLPPLSSLRWGEGRNRRTLYMANNMDQPLIVWIVGIVTARWLFDGNNNPVKAPSINVAPLNEDKLEAWKSLLRKLSEPVTLKRGLYQYIQTSL